MNRRRFLSTSMLTGAAVVLSAGSAHAFSQDSCADLPGTKACLEIARHQEILAQLNAMLEKKGLSEEQRHAILVAAICPFCGQPLIG